MSTPRRHNDVVLEAIAALRAELKDFIRVHDEREREDIRDHQRSDDRITALEKRMDSVDGKEGHVDTLFQKYRALSMKIVWFTGAGAVVAPLVWLIVQWWMMSKLGK